MDDDEVEDDEDDEDEDDEDNEDDDDEDDDDEDEETAAGATEDTTATSISLEGRATGVEVSGMGGNGEPADNGTRESVVASGAASMAQTA